MLVAPCSIKTISGIASSYAENLLLCAADVMHKERRPLVLAVRETPFHLGHIRLLEQAAEIGAVIFPPVPTIYHRPVSLDDVIGQSVGRMIEQVGIVLPDVSRWEERRGAGRDALIPAASRLGARPPPAGGRRRRSASDIQKQTSQAGRTRRALWNTTTFETGSSERMRWGSSRP